MFNRAFWTETRIAGVLLLLSFALDAGGVLLFIARDAGRVVALGSLDPFKLERSLIMAGVVVAVLGFTMLTLALTGANDRYLSWLGLIAIVFGGGLIIVAESFLSGGAGTGSLRSMARIYVALALFSQLTYGVALLQTRLTPKWVGWATIVINVLGFTVVFLRDPYYPGLHHLMLLPIGIALLRSGSG